MTDDLCSTADAAAILDLGEDQVRALVRNGTLPPETRAGGASLWRRSTIERWDDTGRPAGDLPISPPLVVFSLKEIAHRFRVSDYAAKAWRWKCKLPEPTWVCGGIMLWDEDALRAMTPECPGCGMLDVVDSRTVNGKPTEGRCSCGEWVTMTPRHA